MHRRGRDPGQPAAHQALHARPVLQDPGADAGAVCRPAFCAAEHAGDRAPLPLAAGAGQAAAARLSDTAGRRRRAGRAHAHRCLLPQAVARGTGKAPAHALSRRDQAREGACALRRAPGFRARHHHQDGLSGLLPHRLRLHRLGQGKRLPGRPGPGFGCGLAGGLCALHHRPRPALLPAACRCPTSTSTSARATATASSST